MTITQWLKNHADGGWYTADEIGEAMNLSTSYVEGRLGELCDQGVVEYRPRPGRSSLAQWRLAVTEADRRLAEKLSARKKELLAELKEIEREEAA